MYSYGMSFWNYGSRKKLSQPIEASYFFQSKGIKATKFAIFLVKWSELSTLWTRAKGKNGIGNTWVDTNTRLGIKKTSLSFKMEPFSWLFIMDQVNICKFLTINKSIFHPYLYFSFPFIGHLYKFGNKPIECLDECQKNFGDIFRLDTATGPTVWLCNYKQITEAMKSDTFAGRPYHKLSGLTSCRDEKCQ